MEDLLSDIDVQPKLARKSRRWVAAFLDYFFFFVIIMLLSYFFGDAETDGSGSLTWSLTGWPAFFCIVGTWFILLPLIEGLNKGQTFGKAIMGVRAIKDNGDRLSMDRAIARHILDFVDYFPFFGIVGLIVASNNKNNKRVGDMVGNTIVIEA